LWCISYGNLDRVNSAAAGASVASCFLFLFLSGGAAPDLSLSAVAGEIFILISFPKKIIPFFLSFI
tara:strand:+ start:145 stop:342 length:198 start_codon:yes stop_codon:yes gene_type:complete